MRVLVWQWGRRGAGPRLAALLADALRTLPGTEALLSLSAGAEIMRGPSPPRCALPVDTYASLAGFARRLATAPFAVPSLMRRLLVLRPTLAVCMLPGPLDFVMAEALRRVGVPFAVVVHDADHHPGDGRPLQMWLQRRLCRQASALVALTDHVAEALHARGLVTAAQPLIRLSLPPIMFGPPPLPPFAHGGPPRLLCFGRLLPYKGLDLLAAALRRLGPRADLDLRVVGSGPESDTLAALRATPGVLLENRWVPETEVGTLIAWADVLVLPYREATQSGVAASAIAARRWVIATRVGGLTEQLGEEPIARLCAPDAESFADELRRMLVSPPRDLPVADEPASVWRDCAAALLRQFAPLAGVPAGFSAARP